MPFDVIFMSYYEPEAHINYENVLNIRPDAKHLSGIKGIGKAHKQAALLGGFRNLTQRG